MHKKGVIIMTDKDILQSQDNVKTALLYMKSRKSDSKAGEVVEQYGMWGYQSAR